MNVRPNTKPSGGTSSFGVMVSVTVQACGLMSGSLAISSSWDWML